MKRGVLLLLIIFSLLSSIPSKAQATAAPYIYHFSNRLQAFIVERADGTDTRILGDKLMKFKSSKAFN